MSKRILIALTSHDQKGTTGQKTGAYLPEVAHPYEVFARAGFIVDFASVKGGRVPLDGVDRKDEAQIPFLDDAPLARRLHDSAPSRSVDASRYDAILFAGGHGTMWDFPDDEGFQKVAAAIYEKGGVVAAVCHGPAALVNVKLSTGKYLVDGKDVSAFTDDEERAAKLDAVVPFLLQSKLVERGARHQAAPLWQKKVVVSERLVTGQNPASAAGVADAVVRVLEVG
jgi:putative intracellular protease/amidase